MIWTICRDCAALTGGLCSRCSALARAHQPRHCDSCRCPEIARERAARNSPPMEWRYERDPSRPLPVVLL